MIDFLHNLWASFVAFVEAYPPMLALGIIVFAALGVPASALLVLCGAVWGSFMPVGWVVCFGVLSLYLASIWPWVLCSRLPDRWLAKIPFLKPVELRERFLSQSSDVWAFLFVLRFTPGVPFVLHNVVSGVLKIPAKPYLIMSFLSSAVAGVMMILLGDALTSGNLSFFVGVAIVVVVFALVNKKLSARRRLNEHSDGGLSA